MTTWEDFGAEVTSDDSSLPAEIVRLSEKLKARYTPAEFIERACKWIDREMIYDASVSYSSADLDSIVTQKRGHCGHYAKLLRSLCSAAGIPTRRVFGLNLYSNKLEAEPLHKVRRDYVNIHTWVEAHLPKEGWIEVEPSRGKRPFKIPARYIQNDKWFQNYSVWVKDSKGTRQPEWIPRRGGWDSEYSVENRIDFREIPLGAAEERFLPRVWKSNGGDHSIIAALLSTSGEKVNLLSSDGRQLSVSLDRLDAESLAAAKAVDFD